MNDARAWLEVAARRRAAPSLDVALLTERGASYVRSRVTVIGLRALLRVAVHAAELIFLGGVFPLEFLLPLFTMRALPGLLGGVHWGALEALRARVRRELGRGDRAAAAAITEAYLVLASALSAGVLALVTALIATQDDPVEGALGLYGLFAIASALALAIDLYTRTFHAGVFALGRVYRPGWSLLLPDLLELGLIVGAWEWIGPWGLHLAVLLGALLRGAIALLYGRRAYRARRLQLPRALHLRSLRRLARADLFASGQHALATLPLQLDRLLLIALLHAPAAQGALPLALPYYALRPVAAFSSAWARGFYSDFVRLDASGTGVLRARFERLLARASWITGACSALGLTAGAGMLFGAPGVLAGLWLVPLSLVRARFTLEQLRGFVYGAHGALALTGAALLLGLVCAQQLALQDRALLALAVGALLAALWPARRIASRARARQLQRAARLPLSAWLQAVSVQRMPVRIAVARVDARVAGPGAVVHVLAPWLEGRGHVARLGRSWLLWWEPAAQASSRAELARALGGALADVRTASAGDGASALAAMCRERLAPGELAAALSTALPADPRAALRAEAARLVPQAEALDLRASGALLRALSQTQLAAVRQAIVAGAREQQHALRNAPHQVAVYAPGGEPELVFVWPRQPAHDGRAGALRRAVQHASWRASLAMEHTRR